MRISCVICTDNLDNDVAATTCGHVFHYECLNQWLGHSTICPQCRGKCPKKSIIKLYLDSSDGIPKELSDLSSDQLKLELSSERELTKEREKALDRARKDLKETQENLVAWQCQCTSACKKLEQQKDVTTTLRREASRLQGEQEQAEKAIKEASRLRTKLRELRNIENILEGSEEEVEMTVKNYHDSATELAKYFIVLKQNYENLKDRKARLQSQNSSLSLDLTNMNKAWQKTNQELIKCQNDYAMAREEIKSLDQERSSLQRKMVTLQEAIDSPGTRTSLKRMLESPAPEHTEAKKSRNVDLLKELFPPDSSDEEKEVPRDAATSQPSDNKANPNHMALLGMESKVSITSFSAKKRKQFALHQSTSDNISVPIHFKSKQPEEFHKTGYNGMGGQAKVTILPKPTGSFMNGSKKLKFGANKGSISANKSIRPFFRK